jgi:hypothetical protein
VSKNKEVKFNLLLEKFFRGVATPNEEKELANAASDMDETTLISLLKRALEFRD